MSMFRRPGDSSSESDSSYDATENDETQGSQQDSVLSRINTLDSAASGQPAQTQRPTHLEFRQNSAQNVRDLLLHSLLEERTIREVAEQLGKDPSDSDAQRLGRGAYQEIARQISNNVDDTYASNDMQAHRATANEGINRLTRSNLSKLSVIPEGSSQALVTQRSNAHRNEIPEHISPDFNILSGIQAPIELQLRGYPHLQTDRYLREFSELEVVGKGGYGKVYKAKHNLDGSFYAVKRIPISAAKVARIQEHGPQELESMLEEVRSLARFDHNNIVRYHNAWLEFTTTATETSTAAGMDVLRDDRLLEAAATFSSNSPIFDSLQSKLDNLDFDDPFERRESSYGADILFESSNNGLSEDRSKGEDDVSLKEKLKRTKSRTRRGSQASQATVATISSAKSRMSAVEDVDEDEDEDVEIIPRSHMPYSQESFSEVTDSMVSHSDVPGHLVRNRELGPVLMLNVQMSLCETNLAAFMSTDRSGVNAQKDNQHCFHSCVSLEMLSNIISGVEYLHSRGVVHRDLKPANVFLSLSTDRHPPYGSIDMSTCQVCPERERLHVTPRIGDFGLVAALDDKCMGIDTSAHPVGTEFYRPHKSHGISEKIDVFALGVVAFEMLQRFGTRMERVAALTGLRQGLFPDSFAKDLGSIGDGVQQLIGDMINVDEQKRPSCEGVKDEIKKLLHVSRS